MRALSVLVQCTDRVVCGVHVTVDVQRGLVASLSLVVLVEPSVCHTAAVRLCCSLFVC